jgi:hypothetical protein
LVVARFGDEDLVLTRCDVVEITIESAEAAQVQLRPIDPLSRDAKEGEPCRLVFRRDARTHIVDGVLVHDARADLVTVVVGERAVASEEPQPQWRPPFRSDW